MNNPSLLTIAANFVPGLLQVRRTTWIAVGVGLLVLFALLIWAAVALIGSLWGQAQSLAGAAPDAVRSTTRGVLDQVDAIIPGARAKIGEMVPALKGQAENLAGAAPDAVRGATRGVLDQVEAIVPGARDKIGEMVPALKTEAASQSKLQRDVSGTDLGPVARYPGIYRIQWQREGGKAAATYEGTADYATVLDHYAKGFAAQGFVQTVQSATPQAETLEYRKGRELFILKIAQKPKGSVSVSIETTLQ